MYYLTQEVSYWNVVASYLPQTMGRTKPGVLYVVEGRAHIMPSVFGGYYVSFKVKIPEEHYTGYLKISILQDGRYSDASFD